ncbi:type II and III secretion system protein family protein [Caulobacter sp. S45]|uniref:type II and III secretion system protein family protein n=1 Tax=Caulobacter sp. S45 TaxID=1641861 RepID=UPI0020C638B1|nr:type II and III secretion system protein family protein [Caulobacter sp. S45]
MTPKIKPPGLRPAGHPRAPLRTVLAHMSGLAVVSAVLLAGGSHAHAQPAHAWPGLRGAPDGETVKVSLGGAGSASRNLSLPKGKSAVIELPVDARDVMVSNPKVADVVLSTPRRIYVLGQDGGQTDATFVDGMGRQILRLNIRVDNDTSAVAETLNHVLPGSSIHVEAVNDRLILSGEAPNAADADKAMRVAQSFVEKPENVLNMISVAGPEQVMLKVRIIEVNRQIIKQLGVSLQALVAQLDSRASQFSAATQAVYGVNGSALGGLTASYQTFFNQLSNGNYGTSTEGVLQAFEQTNLVRTLAEPNLTAVSGESAKFLAGGEFPVPVSEDNNGRVTVEFKQFGVGLGFTPVVLSSGRISLKLSTEYSELTNIGGFSLSSGTSSASTTSGTTASTTSGTGTATTGQGITLSVPGLNVRRAETTVELPSGGAMMIAGLLESSNKQSISGLPGLGGLPVLGALFRSRDYLQGESELVVIVTPYLVKPTRPDLIQTPADGLQVADDASAYLLGKLNQGFSRPAAPLPGKSYQGPFGYVVQ